MLLCGCVLNQSSKLLFFVGKMGTNDAYKVENNRGEEGKCVSGTSEAPMNECTEACNYHIKMESIRTFKVMNAWMKQWKV